MFSLLYLSSRGLWSRQIVWRCRVWAVTCSSHCSSPQLLQAHASLPMIWGVWKYSVKEWKNAMLRLECFPHADIRGGNQIKTFVAWMVISGPRQTLHSGGSKVISLYPFYVLGLWMSRWEAAATDAVPIRFLESTWPPSTSAVGIWTMSQNSKPGTETATVLVAVHPGLCPQAS